MEEKLLIAVREKLEKNGTMGFLRSEFESEILDLLGLINGLKRHPSAGIPTDKVHVCDRLVADYLDWRGYTFTSGIFQSESCLRNDNAKVSREQLLHTLALGEATDDSVPLICHLVRNTCSTGE